MQRKAQITLFIILGLAMLFFIAGYIYFQMRGTGVDETRIPAIKDVPLELQPLNSYVETCITQVALEGLKKLGEHGGYIKPLEWGLHVDAISPTDGDAVEFLPGTGLIVPYWFYLKSDNDCSDYCEFSYQIPNLYRTEGEPSMEGQLDDYVNENLASCLSEFSYFETQGFKVEPLGDVETETTVFSDDIGFYVEYPLKFVKESRVHMIEEYFVRVPLNLKAIYEQASLITNLQVQYQFLEKDLLNLIVAYSGVDEDKLPPMAATDFEFGGGTMWSKSAVRMQVEDILVSYIPALQVFGSLNYEPLSFPGDPFREILYNSGMLIVSDTVFPQLGVVFNYLDFWPIYFDLNCEGEICKPESASSNLLTLIGIQRYNFLYDVSYPTLVAISDHAALNNMGYEFQFFLEANIRDNHPLNSTYVPLVSTLGVEASMLCDMDKRNTGHVTVTVTDSIEGVPVDDVEVIYTCIEESCSMGKTKEGVLNTAFPVCMGGIVSFLREGYLGASRWLTTELDQEYAIEIELMPIRTLQFSVEKYPLVKTGDSWVLRNNPIYLGDNEEAVLTLERVGALGDGEHMVLAQFYGNESGGEIELAPGEYIVNINLMLNEEIVIHPQKRCEDVGFSEECFYVPPETVTLEKPFISGGLSINYSFSVEEVQKSHVTFYAIYADVYGIPEQKRVIEDLEQPAKVADYSYAYKNLLRPKFE